MSKKKKRTDCNVVARDICVALLDVTGDWIYFSVYFFSGSLPRHRYSSFNTMMYVVLFISILGSILSTWVIATSLGRIRRYKSLCCKCTVPKLAVTLIAVHHVPQFILTTYIDLTFSGYMTWMGCFNIFSSLVAMVNALVITEHGERLCTDEILCGGLCINDLEIGKEGDEEVGGDYEEMSSDTKTDSKTSSKKIKQWFRRGSSSAAGNEGDEQEGNVPTTMSSSPQ